MKILDLITAPARCALSLLDKYDMEANKICAAIFFAGIIAMFAGLFADVLYPSGHDKDAKRGYEIAGAAAFEPGAATTAVEEVEEVVDIAVFLASADIAAGEKLIKRCTACHTFDKGGKQGVGPNNYGIVGADIGHVAGFKYSDALMAKAAGGKQWTFEELSAFLENPKKYAPGNKMAFAGLRKPADRANLMAYLNTLSDKPLPYPEPKPVVAAEEIAPDTAPVEAVPPAIVN